MVHPAVILLGLAGAGYGGYQLVKKPKKGDFQTQNLLGQGGVPIKVVTPIPKKATPVQSKTPTVRAPSPKAVTVPQKATTAVPHPTAKTVVFAPPKAVIPNQPAPIIVTPTGASSVVISTTKDVQRALNTLGFLPKLVEDGIIGPKTIANIKQFQSKNSLAVDGNAGPATKAALSTALTRFASGGTGTPAVVKETMAAPKPPSLDVQAAAAAMGPVDVQHALNLLGASPKLVEDGKIGPKSVAAIKSFQLSHALVADGIAGPATKVGLITAVGHPVKVVPIKMASTSKATPIAPYISPTGPAGNVSSGTFAEYVSDVSQSIHDEGMREMLANGDDFGADGMTVADAQKILNYLGVARLAVDNHVGPQTVQAIQKFQAKYGLHADGKLGPRTKTVLCKAMQLAVHCGEYC